MWNTSSRSKRKSADPWNSDVPAWNKEEQHATMEHQRHQIDSGELDAVRPSRPTWPFTVIGVLLIVGAFALGIFGILELRKQQSGGEWPTTSATVTSTSIQRYFNDKHNARYTIWTTYTYTIKGHNYQFTISADTNLYQDEAESQRNSYMGRHKTVWYNPDSPDQNLTLPVVATFSVVGIVGAAVALIVGIFFFMQGAPSKRVA